MSTAIDAHTASSQEAIAQALGVDRRTVRRLIDDFAIQPAGRRAGRAMFRAEDVAAALRCDRSPDPTPAEAVAALADLAANLPNRLARAGVDLSRPQEVAS